MDLWHCFLEEWRVDSFFFATIIFLFFFFIFFLKLDMSKQIEVHGLRFTSGRLDEIINCPIFDSVIWDGLGVLYFDVNVEKRLGTTASSHATAFFFHFGFENLIDVDAIVEIL
jgi:hypothetical protein